MRKKNKPNRNKQTRNKEIEKPLVNPYNQPPVKEPTGNTPKNHSEDKERKSTYNRGLLWVNIGMLSAFIVVNYFLIDGGNKNLELIEKSNKIALRAFVNIASVELKQFRVGEEIVINISERNVGRTPAFNVESYIKVKMGGTGIYDTDWVIPDTGETRTNYW